MGSFPQAMFRTPFPSPARVMAPLLMAPVLVSLGVLAAHAQTPGGQVQTPSAPRTTGAMERIEAILADFPYLETEDILQALRYAAWRTEEREIALARE